MAIDIHGIVDTVFDGIICFRGFADISDIKKFSSSGAYQRDLIPAHKEEIKAFYNKGTNLFFPEIILGCKVEEWVLNKLKDNKTFTQEGKYKLYLRPQNRAQLKIYSDQVLFSRIDGNHRLEAITEAIISNMLGKTKVPFCIIFSPIDDAKMERVIFNNINFKNKPLKKQQNLENIFNSNDDLSAEYGEEYFKTKEIQSNLLPAVYEKLKEIFPMSYWEVIFDLVKFLSIKEITKGASDVAKKIGLVLNPEEGIVLNKGLFIAMVCFALEDNKKLKAFSIWIKKYHISKLSEVSALDLVNIYQSIYTQQSRQIFVSMPFKKDETDNHFTMICEVVDAINREFPNNVAIPKPIRIDSLQDSGSFNIHKEIYEGIEHSAFLIADLTYARPNVYHEVGYAMGIAKSNKFEDNILLIIEAQPSGCHNSDPYKVHFNLSCNNYLTISKIDTFKKDLRDRLIRYFNIK